MQGNTQTGQKSDSEIVMDIPQPESLEHQEISANVTVVTTAVLTQEVSKPTIGQLVSHDLLLGK